MRHHFHPFPDLADKIYCYRCLPQVAQEDETKGQTMIEQACRVCGCTNDDCLECWQLTGRPCYWVEEDLCSRCAKAEDEAQAQLEAA